MGYYAVFTILDLENRFNMSQLLQDSNCGSLQKIRINKSEVNDLLFEDNGKEITYNGEMYDVKSEIQDGDYIIFYCLDDKKETTLLASLNDQIQNNIGTHSASGQKQNNILKVSLNDYCNNMNRSLFLRISLNVIYPTSNPTVSSPLISFPSPPPEIPFS